MATASIVPVAATSRRPTSRMSMNRPPQENLLKSMTNLLWGQSLPPQLLISTARTLWSSTWHLMMSQLAPSDPTSGSYSRPASPFRINPAQSPTTTSLHLYVGLPCPWAHRTLVVRALKGLEEAIPVSVASPGLDGAWQFRDFVGPRSGVSSILPSRDGANGFATLREVYGGGQARP